MFEQLLTIGRNTFVESIRQPVFLVLVGVGLLGMVLNVALAAYAFEEDNRKLIELGMSTLLLVSLLLAAFTATNVVSNEIENQTVLTTVSKPVTRPVFILGKYLGVSTAIGLAFWILAMVLFMTIRHRVMTTASDRPDGPVITFFLVSLCISLFGATIMNYLYQWVFSATFIVWMAITQPIAWLLVLLVDKQWALQPITAEFTAPDSVFAQLHLALFLLFQGLLILTAVAVATSTRLGQVMTIVISLSVFAMAIVSATAIDYYDVQSPLARALTHLVPNMQYLWHADALGQGHSISLEHVALVSGYAMLFVTAFVSLAVALFQTREVG